MLIQLIHNIFVKSWDLQLEFFWYKKIVHFEEILKKINTPKCKGQETDALCN